MIASLLTDESAGVDQAEGAGYKGQFEHAWRWRFRWMHPGDQAAALIQEWRRYKAGQPSHWYGIGRKRVDYA